MGEKRNMTDSTIHGGLDYWLQWQVPVSAIVVVLPAAVTVVLLTKRNGGGGGGRDTIRPSDLWTPCWKNLHPRWLLFYRAFAFIIMAFLLYEIATSFGSVAFFFYTQWTFTLVALYFALGTIVSARGCRIYEKKPADQTGEREKFLKRDSEEVKNGPTSASEEEKRKGSIKLDILDNLLLVIYQTCAGAALLTDIVFWGLLVPFMTGENFKLTLLIGYMHSVNAVFLLVDSALNRLPFTWFGFIYFILWSFIYIVFQWVVHACCVSWWPYPFLELSTPWAPLWYFAMALVHLPCYGLYVFLTKAKYSAFSTMFPRAFLRSN